MLSKIVRQHHSNHYVYKVIVESTAVTECSVKEAKATKKTLEKRYKLYGNPFSPLCQTILLKN